MNPDRRFPSTLMAAVLLCFAAAALAGIPLRSCKVCTFRSKAYYAKQNGVCSRVSVSWEECYRRWEREQGSACEICRGSRRVSVFKDALCREP